MSVSYTCPNPECGATLKSPNRLPTGKQVKCPKCAWPFVPEPEEAAAPAAAGPGTFKLADEEPSPAKKGPAVKGQKGGAKAEPPPAAGSAAPKSRFADEDDEDAASVKKGYGVVKESQEEIDRAEKNKPKFTEIQDKFKKSARGPAVSLLVMPANLLTLEGLITGVAGLVIFVYGMWPLVFNDAPPSDEEVDEAIVVMILGMVAFGWGAMICIGASQMQEIRSYTWAIAGAVMGVLPLLVGVYALIMLQNPKVKAGFAEIEGAIDEDEDDEQQKDDAEAGDDEDDDDDDD
jgi:hypothetical protein